MKCSTLIDCPATSHFSDCKSMPSTSLAEAERAAVVEFIEKLSRLYRGGSAVDGDILLQTLAAHLTAGRHLAGEGEKG